MKMTLKQKMIGLTAFSSLGLLIIGLLGVNTSNHLLVDLDDVIFKSIPIIRNLTLIDMVHEGVRGATLESYKGHLLKDSVSINSSAKILAQLKETIEKDFKDIEDKLDNENDKKNFKHAKILMMEYIVTSEEFNILCRSEKTEDLAKVWKKFDLQFEKLEKVLGDLGDSTEKKIQANFLAKIESGKTASQRNIFFGIFFILFSFGMSLISVTKISNIFNNITSEVGSASSNVGI
ncbi:MAG: hypothetical protein L6Q37_06830, partial [Bdellovibrionaceae bacterium]|nr:hypothetical protein [Pseudobdellovibrionaceae bacterium]